MKRLLLPLLLLTTGIVFAQKMKEPYLIVGTYTSGESKGVHVYKFNTTTGDASHVSTINSSNPSFLTISPDQKFIYAVNEDDPGMVTPQRMRLPEAYVLHACPVRLPRTTISMR